MKGQRVWIVAALLLVLIAACSPQSTTVTVIPAVNGGESAADQPEAEYRTLTIDQFADILADENSGYTIINVHIPFEGEVAGTDAHVAYNDLDALVSALPDPNAPIVLYCRSGSMSETASRALVERGYTQVYDVPGGMIAWEQSGRELVMRAG